MTGPLAAESTAAESTGAPNPWFSWTYLEDYSEDIVTALQEHIVLTLVSVGLGLAISIPLALLALRSAALETVVLGVTGAIYTVPSLALFGLLLPITGLSRTTVVAALVAYSLLVLVRNTLTGLRGVPEEVREAARGMGFSPGRQLLRVDLPLALPTIVAGLRIATVSTIALVTVGALVGYGGFGGLIVRGFNNNLFRAEIVVGCLGCVALALVADLLLLGVQRALSPWARQRVV